MWQHLSLIGWRRELISAAIHGLSNINPVYERKFIFHLYINIDVYICATIFDSHYVLNEMLSLHIYATRFRLIIIVSLLSNGLIRYDDSVNLAGL